MSNSKDDIWNLRCEIWNSERQGGIAPPGSHSKTRNAAAPYELALRAERRYQPGDQISYYVTGAKAKVKISDNCSHPNGTPSTPKKTSSITGRS
jgi:hypothetical protein